MKCNWLFLILCFSISLEAQNDLDAIRYSRLGTNGSARYASMAGAFGALGADLSCASTNPGALGVFTKGELNFGAGLRFTHDKGTISGGSNTLSDANFVFNNFGIAVSWTSAVDPESRHLFAFTNNQLINFNEKAKFSNYTNSASIVKDMMNKTQGVSQPKDLNYSYEGAAWNVYLIDTAYGKYFSFVDLKRTVLQTREISTKGKVNEMNISYAYTHKDKFYFGASLGLPRVTYTSTTLHTELDDKDSMRVTVTNTATGAYTSTYIDGLPAYYSDKLGFNSLVYKEFFASQGNGLNLKLGVVLRANDHLRFGLWYHTITVYTMKDVYYNEIKATFDKDKSQGDTYKYPDNGGYFDYKITSPSKIGASIGYILGKKLAIGADYELTNYSKARLSSDVSSDFEGVNAVITRKYTIGNTLRLGAEYNVRPIMIRAGYIMQGSPFGHNFTGHFVRNSFSLGCGWRTRNNFYYDVCWNRSLISEDYYMFTTIEHTGTIQYVSSSLNVTVGVKF